MKRLACLAALAFTSGCSVVALHPLAGDGAIPADRSIAGLWKPVGEPEQYRITQADERSFGYCELKETQEPECGKIQLIRLGGDLYADIVPNGGIVPLHLIARVKITADEIRLSALNKVDPKTAPRHEIVGKGDDKQLVFTASTAELRAALPGIAKTPGAFGDEGVLQRVK